MLRDREDLLAQAGLHRLADAVRQRCLETRGRFGEELDLIAGALERRLQHGRLRSPLGRPSQSLVCPLDRAWIHGPQR